MIVEKEYSDWIIPVTLHCKDGTTQVIEDSILVDCDHFGAQPITLTSHMGTDYESEQDVLVCPHCQAQEGLNGEWIR